MGFDDILQSEHQPNLKIDFMTHTPMKHVEVLERPVHIEIRTYSAS